MIRWVAFAMFLLFMFGAFIAPTYEPPMFIRVFDQLTAALGWLGYALFARE